MDLAKMTEVRLSCLVQLVLPVMQVRLTDIRVTEQLIF